MPPKGSKSFAAKLAKDSDVISITHAVYPAADLVKTMTSSSQLLLNVAPRFKKNDRLIIADCETVDSFTVQSSRLLRSVKMRKIISKQTLSKHYPKYSTIAKLVQESFYIADSKRKNNRGEPIFSLYRRKLSGRSEELIVGIEKMHVRYGVSDKHHHLLFVTGDKIKDKQVIKTIKLALLLDSVDSVNTTAMHYFFDGKRYQVNDKRLHKQWNIVIRL